ncbi:MAG: hypothetical protein JNM68_07845 [Dinghuibacter sp.]|nr:hypothetical protein [Dinghuibacter sp.]
MPDKKQTLSISARETIKNLNNRDCLVICVELGPGYFAPRAIPYDVALEDTHAFMVQPSDDLTVLYAFFTLRIPLKGKLYYGYADGLEKESLPFNFEKKPVATLDRKRITGRVKEIMEFKDLLVKS